MNQLELFYQQTSIGEQVIGYGPDIIDDEGSINKHQDDGSDVHSPPPPSIKGAFPLPFFLLECVYFMPE